MHLLTKNTQSSHFAYFISTKIESYCRLAVKILGNYLKKTAELFISQFKTTIAITFLLLGPVPYWPFSVFAFNSSKTDVKLSEYKAKKSNKLTYL